MTTEILHLDYGFEVRASRDEERALDVIASTAALDSYGEIVMQDWDLTRYAKNPVVFFGHDSRGLPVGKAENVRVEEGRLLATLKFVDAKANPFAEQVWESIKQGALSAVSVGFRAGAVHMIDLDGKQVAALTGNELLEISVVGIPANPEAVALARRSLDTIRARVARDTSTEIDMSIKLLLPVLGLAETAIEADAVSAVTSLKSFEREMMTVTGKATVAEAMGVVQAWKSSADKVVELQATVEEMQTAAANRERASLIEKARKDGKLAPAMVEWAKACPIDTLKAFVDTAPAIPQFQAPAVEPQHAASALEWNGKSWSDLSFGERHELHDENIDLYRAMREAAERS
jgi:HK97 family phage prohead protease